MLGRIMYGGQVSLEVGFAAAAIATVIGVLFGAISGFFVGWVDSLMMRIVDVLLSVPILFLVIVLAVIFHPSLEILILVIGFTAWLVPARLVRGETLSLRVREYVLAVRVMGGGRHAHRACGTSSRTRSARSSSTRRSRSRMRSCCSPRSGSSASASRRR